MAQQDEFEAKADALLGWPGRSAFRRTLADALRAEHTRGQIEGLDALASDPCGLVSCAAIRDRIAELRKGAP